MQNFQDHPPVDPTFRLSFGIEKSIITELGQQETVTEQELLTAVLNGFSKVYPLNQVKGQLEILTQAVLDRINALHEGKADQSTGSKAPSRTLGSRFSDWLTELDAEQTCLYLSDFDPEAAYDYYWRCDIETVKEAIKLKTQYDSQKLLASFEAAMYGFGGKYQDDNAGGSGNTIDLNTDEGVAALKAFGF